jgi:hypothetical protein
MSTPSPRSWFVLALAVGAGCTGGTVADDSAASPEYCSTLDDGGTSVLSDGGGNVTSGKLHIRVLTTESFDPKDPLYVAFKDYTLENLDSGGVKTTGKTSGDGLVDVQLGAGNWEFTAAYTRGSLTCLAVLDVALVAGKTTEGCAVLSCP